MSRPNERAHAGAISDRDVRHGFLARDWTGRMPVPQLDAGALTWFCWGWHGSAKRTRGASRTILGRPRVCCCRPVPPKAVCDPRALLCPVHGPCSPVAFAGQVALSLRTSPFSLLPSHLSLPQRCDMQRWGYVTGPKWGPHSRARAAPLARTASRRAPARGL